MGSGATPSISCARVGEVEPVLLVDQERMKPSLEEMAGAGMRAVEPPGVAAVEPMHAPRQVRLRRPDHEMEVIRHQHPGRDAPAEALDGFAEETQEGEAIAIGAEDGAALIAPGGDVITAPANSMRSGRAMHRGPRSSPSAEESKPRGEMRWRISSERKIALRGVGTTRTGEDRRCGPNGLKLRIRASKLRTRCSLRPRW
jgi:hypothetical protein